MPAKAARPDPLTIAFELVAEQGWAGLSMTDLADRAKLSLVELYRELPGRGAILSTLSRRVDEAMLGGDEGELEGLPPRDRVLELLLRRFDALAPFRAGLKRLAADGCYDPGVVLLTACRLDRSMAWLQDAARLRRHGLRARLARRALSAVYFQAVRVWLMDDTVDMAKTMAELDKQLRRVGGIAGLREPRTRPAADGEAAATA